jgi:hypothetical protein
LNARVIDTDVQVDKAVLLPERAANSIKCLAAHMIEREVERPASENKEFAFWRLGSKERFRGLGFRV